VPEKNDTRELQEPGKGQTGNARYNIFKKRKSVQLKHNLLIKDSKCPRDSSAGSVQFKA
jgi:hypothetical protein